MAAKLPAEPEKANPCCAAWQKKYLKSEASRSHLREAVSILQKGTEDVQAHHSTLKKEYEELRVLADNEKEERVKESAARVSLENEVSELKSEILSLKQREDTDSQDKEEVKFLEGKVAEQEQEISRLKELNEKEMKRADSESKKTAVEKKKAAEAQKSMKIETKKADEERKRADMEGKKAENYRLRVEVLEKEAAIGNSHSEVEKEIGCLRELIEREKKRAESESKKAEVEKKKVSEAQKSLKIEAEKAEEERKRANIEAEKAENYRLQVELLEKEAAKEKFDSEGEKEISCLKELIEKEKKRAESESKKAEAEKKKAAEALKSMKTEKRKAEEERKRANSEAEKAENYRLRLEVFEKEADKAKSDLASEIFNLEAANKKLETEKQKVVKEKERANSEMAKAEEQRKLVEANRQRIVEENSRAESLSLQLVESRKRVDELQKELNEIRCSSKLQVDLLVQPQSNRTDASKEISNLEEAIKRFEVEKQKAMKEKKRADLEVMKTQKQKQLAEVYMKKVAEEKSRGDHLSQQLDEAKKKIAELSARNLIEVSAVQQLAKGSADSAKVKLLKKQLKLEKMQRKYSEAVVKVKMERVRNSILHQEFGCLKLDVDHISQRLDMLNDCFSYDAEGIDDHEKTWNIMKKQQLSYKNYQGLESLRMNLQSGTNSLKPAGPVLDASDPFREAMQHTGPYPLLSGGNYTGSISGIDSKLESPRGSKRNMLQSSAINSSTASFSDGQLLGSQGKGAFSVTMPTKSVEENVQPAISNLSTEVIKRKCNETIAVVAENTVKSPLRIDGIGIVNERGRKRKRMIDAVESIESLYCQGKKFHQQAEEKLSDLHRLLSKKIKKPVDERQPEKREAVRGGLASSLVSNEQKKADGIENECANACRHVLDIAGELIGAAQASREGISDHEIIDVANFDEVTDGNYLKLLELDNAADEQCYRMAMDMPLSPTLPEIEVQDVESSHGNKINPLIKETICDRYSNKNGGHDDCCDIEGLNRNGSGISVAMGKPWDMRVQDAGAEVAFNAPVLRSDGAAGDNILKYYVVFSNTEDSSSICRICNAFKTCVEQCSLAIRTEWMVREILFAVENEEKLLPKEKVCVLFSLLLLNCSIASSSKFGSMYWESKPCLESFARHMCSVIFDWDGRRIFLEFGGLDELFGLMEDLIIYGRVFDCKHAPSKKMVECDSSSSLLDNIDISPRPASADELVAGSIVLGSLCAAFDHIGFICETSCNMLRIRTLNCSLVLKMLHVFAHLGGEKFFNNSNYTSVTVIKSMVTFLEGARASDSAGSSTTSASNSGTEFRPCVNCPFSKNAVCVDTATSSLLEKLQSDVFLGHPSHDVVQAVKSNSSLSLGDLSDLLSLVELVASNMGWTWTSVKVIPQLMKILESCHADNVMAGILVLLGQLGRFGVDSVGYEDQGVEFLRHKLSAYLCRDSATGAGLPTQIATVMSMLCLMSYDFKTIIQSNADPSAVASQSGPSQSSQSGPSQSIRKWFSLLPKKQRDLSFSLLQAKS